MAVFDQFWFEVELEPFAGIRSAIREGKPVESVAFQLGTPILDAVDDRYEYRELLSDRFDMLAIASWRTDAQPTVTLGQLVDTAHAAWSEVTDALGIDATERLRLKRGQRALSADEATALAELLRTTPEDVLATNPAVPQALADAIDHPRWKGLIRERGRSRSLGEGPARYEVALSAMAQAARETVPAAEERHWAVRLEHVFAT